MTDEVGYDVDGSNTAVWISGWLIWALLAGFGIFVRFVLKDFTFTHTKFTHTKFEKIDVGLILTLCFLIFNVFDEFLKNVFGLFWGFFFFFFFFFWREVFDQTNAYVAFLYVNLNFFY